MIQTSKFTHNKKQTMSDPDLEAALRLLHIHSNEPPRFDGGPYQIDAYSIVSGIPQLEKRLQVRFSTGSSSLDTRNIEFGIDLQVFRRVYFAIVIDDTIAYVGLLNEKPGRVRDEWCFSAKNVPVQYCWRVRNIDPIIALRDCTCNAFPSSLIRFELLPFIPNFIDEWETSCRSSNLFTLCRDVSHCYSNKHFIPPCIEYILPYIQPDIKQEVDPVFGEKPTTENLLDVTNIFDDIIDATDYRGDWYRARIVCKELIAAPDQYRIGVHFCGWDSRYDEWIQYPKEKNRLMPQGTSTARTAYFVHPNVDTLLPESSETVGNAMQKIVLKEYNKWASVIYVDPKTHKKIRLKACAALFTYQRVLYPLYRNQSNIRIAKVEKIQACDKRGQIQINVPCSIPATPTNYNDLIVANRFRVPLHSDTKCFSFVYYNIPTNTFLYAMNNVFRDE